MCLARPSRLTYHWAAGWQQQADLRSNNSLWRTPDTFWRHATSGSCPAVPHGSWVSQIVKSFFFFVFVFFTHVNVFMVVYFKQYLCVGRGLWAIQRWGRQVQPSRHQSRQRGAHVFCCVQQGRQEGGNNIDSCHDRGFQNLLNGTLQQVPVFSFQRLFRSKIRRINNNKN